MKTEQS